MYCITVPDNKEEQHQNITQHENNYDIFTTSIAYSTYILLTSKLSKAQIKYLKKDNLLVYTRMVNMFLAMLQASTA